MLINIISNTILLIDTINLLVMRVIDFLPLWKTAIVSKASAEQDSFDLRPESSVAAEVTGGCHLLTDSLWSRQPAQPSLRINGMDFETALS